MVNGPMRLFVTNRFSALLLAMASALGLATLVGWGGDAVPAVALNVQPSVLLGQSFTFTVSFDNTSDDTTGYGPFIDIAYDATGPDGAVSEPYDGLVVSTSVSYLGNTLPASYVHELTFDDNANGGLGIRHPFAKDNSGNYVYVKTTDFGPGRSVSKRRQAACGSTAVWEFYSGATCCGCQTHGHCEQSG
jgi:hypothetical protein